MTRCDGRTNEKIRKFEIIPDYLQHAEGSCLVNLGNTKVICAASVDEKIPVFLRGTGRGWITAEYSLLPRSTCTRTDREAVKGKQSGRTHEIQRLIGRSLRAAVDLTLLNEKQIKVDCDVIQADGGTRTASICGACVALGQAIKWMNLPKNPMKHLVAAISCGLVNNEVLLDLDYSEDSKAQVDANFIMTETGQLVEAQATGEQGTLSDEQLFQMITFARNGLQEIFEIQKSILLR
ncbi:MAG: ribonuclease PH [Alphaproteobacteria bacterium]|nr:ribonuclease PH [Alphaproteobacteria bacterium]